MVVKVEWFNCPGGCGGVLKIHKSFKTGNYRCPGCGKVFSKNALVPYKTRKKVVRSKTSEQSVIVFMPRNCGGQIYLENWDKKQELDRLNMLGKRKKRE